MNIKIIGKNIKIAREMLGISQKELAQKLGLSWEMISRYENGRSNPLNNLPNIALNLSQNIDFFFKVSQSESLKSKIPFFFETSINYAEKFKNADTYYQIPEWVMNKYSRVFALRLDKIRSQSLDFKKNDVGIFTLELEGKFIYYLSRGTFVKHIPENSTNLAGLIYLERRFVS